ncbi:unannotated protein [freshwater metagenome]|uniref:glucose-1-phosphate thymidylyltransferase n=1 Tax=freshwater metagenome TaxID=449393 RepID=A0A6J6VA10_9ZZZZ|nr:NTP transferase domain-containing protein [Actinomycetota bacterium]
MTKECCGIIMAGGNGTRLSPLTISVNKHLLPVYDKPMIYYPLSTLMMSGIRDIAIITRKDDRAAYERLLGSGRQIGISLTYLEQEEPKGIPQAYQISSEFIGNRNVGLILGDNIFLGQGMGNLLKKASQTLHAEIFAFPVKNPEDYGVVVLDEATNKIIKIVEKPKIRQSNLAIPGLYFTNSDVVNRSRNLKTSSRGEFEITDVLNSYLSEDKLEIEIFRRGIGWMDAGSVESLYSAGELIRVLQERQGLRFGSPEEIAWRNGWISSKELLASTSKYGDTSYGVYLNSILTDLRL